MRKTVVILASALLLLANGPVLAGEPASATPPSPYTLTVIPFYSPEKLWTLYSPLIGYLIKTTGQAWELKLYHDHEAVIDALCKGEVSVALLGPVPMGRVYQKCGARPVLVALGKDGKPFYRSVIVTNDRSVTSLKMLEGKKFGLLKGSTAAHIVPLKMMKDAGVGPGSIKQIFFEGQDRIMTALLSQEVQAAGVKDALYRKFEHEEIKLLKSSDLLPNFAFCAAPTVKPAVLRRFKQQLLRLKPLSGSADARTVRDWDDEIRNGFTRAGAEYLRAVIRLHGIYEEIAHEDR